jgi:hypothetical protein
VVFGVFAEVVGDVPAKWHDAELVGASKFERCAREFSGEAVTFERRRNFRVSEHDVIGEAAVVHQSAKAVDLRFETMRFFIVNYRNLAEIQVHESTRGFFRFFIPEITERPRGALLDLPDDAFGG